MTSRRKRPWRSLVVVLAVLAAVVLLWNFAPLDDWVRQLTSTVRALGPWGPVAFGVGYVLAVLALVPAAPLTLAAAIAFGPWAFPLVIVAAATGATLAFLAARYLARDAVLKFVRRHRTLRAVDQAIGEGSWKIVALMRLSPVVPFSLQNYLFGATDIGLKPFALVTFFGIMPGTLLYVYLGAAGQAALSRGLSAEQWAYFGVGFVATAVAVFLIARKARARLAAHGVRSHG
jgi:uncharacterized membrane protein YdjX (TVP38/TMEM64 family)